MTIDERNRLQLAEAAKRVLGDDEGITLMELLPPVGWADVATKQDLAVLQTQLEAAPQLEVQQGQGDRQSFAIVDHSVDMAVGAMIVLRAAAVEGVVAEQELVQRRQLVGVGGVCGELLGDGVPHPPHFAEVAVGFDIGLIQLGDEQRGGQQPCDFR